MKFVRPELSVLIQLYLCLFVQVGKFLQLLATFIGGFIIAFIKGWLLTLVMLSSIPLMVAAGATMSIIITKMASRGQAAYANAANVVEQTIGSIRTVCHICFISYKYNCSLFDQVYDAHHLFSL